MNLPYDLIIVTADEPYAGLSHTQVLYADYLARFNDLIYIEAPQPWHILKIFRRNRLQQVVKKGPTVFSYFNLLPAAVPFAKKINEGLLNRALRTWLTEHCKKNILVWHFDSYRSEIPRSAFSPTITMQHVYHVIDPFFNNPLDAALCNSADLIVVTSPAIAMHYNKHKDKLQIIPQCIDLELCKELLALPVVTNVPEGPFFIFLGTLSDDIDFELLQSVAQLGPLLIAGKVLKMQQKQAAYQLLLHHRHVTMAGLLTPAQFYPLLKRAVAGLICYDTKVRTQAFSPLKAVNYLVAGIPVISNCRTEIEVLEGNYVYEQETSPGFLALCSQALEGTLKKEPQALADYLARISLDGAVEHVLEKLRQGPGH
jgi:hypothetical protein